MNTVELKVENFIKDYYPHIDLDQLKISNEPLYNVFNFDSLGFVRFIVDLENFLGKEIVSPDIYNINNTYSEFLKIIKNNNIDK